ncbi:hypothetical protein Chor_000215 [Crotalus horridus]
MQTAKGWILVCLLLCGLSFPRLEAVKISKRPMRSRSCADRPEELLEQLYGRLTAGMLSAFHHTLQISYDSTRYPKYIPEAYCLCKGCLTGDYGEENLHFRSTPVFMPTVILHRTTSCTGGRYAYTEDYVSIPVGCTCVPESEKEAQVNFSIDKRAVKLMGNQNNDKPASK